MGGVHERAPGAGAHGREIAQVDRKGLVPDGTGRSVRPEVNVGDEGVERDRDGAGALRPPGAGRHRGRSEPGSRWAGPRRPRVVIVLGPIALHGITYRDGDGGGDGERGLGRRGFGALPPRRLNARAARGASRIGVQFRTMPTIRATFCPISLSSGKDSMPITEYPRSHGIT